VRKRFKIRYPEQGMVQTLRRLGYRYKKARSVPGKMDVEKQKAFIKTYKRRYGKVGKEGKVYFMDGSHPTYNNHVGYGWIEQGREYGIRSQDGRKRINLLGAYDVKSGEAIVQEYETLNQETTIAFLEEVRRREGEKKLYMICDNVRYQHARAVKEAAKRLKIKLVYLPGYPPNLNLIERYWGYLKKAVMVNKHYETFELFKGAILNFTRNKSKRLRESLKKYIPEKFHLLEPAFT
jgi:transposase